MEHPTCGRPLAATGAVLVSHTNGLPRRLNLTARALTLIEVVIAIFLFGLMAIAAIAGLIHTRRLAEDNIAAATARAVAQGIMEQARLENATILASGADKLPLRFIGTNANNFASIDQRSIPIATDSGSYTRIGSLEDPDNPDSPVLGIMLDTEFRDSNDVLIRPARYMDMEVNFQVTSREPTRRFFTATLTYRWKSPARQNANWITREIQTAIAYTSSF